MKSYLISLAQAYPNFRRPELEALADYYGFSIDLLSHDENKPFMVVQLENDDQARKLIERSILSKGIYELWGEGKDIQELHKDVKQKSQEKFQMYQHCSFKFDFVSYKGSKTAKQKFETIESFSFLAFQGPIKLKNPDETFAIIEEYEVFGREKAICPKYLWFGRQIQLSARTHNILDKYDLRRRKYIGTTSFDAELSLVSCNIAQVGPKKIVYDPFTGTGSFLVAASNFGGLTLGSDIDVRALKGKQGRDIKLNFDQYETTKLFLDILTMDFTNNAFRADFKIDTIVCDPPYGVREGLKVCGAKNEGKAIGRENVVIDGQKAHLRREYMPSKKPYELSNLLDDLLTFSAWRLPVGGRLAFWMPTANDDFEINQIPQHKNLKLIHNLEQVFNKWSRRLLVYVKMDMDYQGLTKNGLKESNIKNFRDRYFKGFSESSK